MLETLPIITVKRTQRICLTVILGSVSNISHICEIKIFKC